MDIISIPFGHKIYKLQFVNANNFVYLIKNRHITTGNQHYVKDGLKAKIS